MPYHGTQNRRAPANALSPLSWRYSWIEEVSNEGVDGPGISTVVKSKCSIMYARVTVGRSFQTSLKVEEEGAATLTFTSNPKTETAHDSNMARSTEVNEFRTKVDRNQQELRRQLSQKLREA